MSYKENYKLIDWSKPIDWEPERETPPARSDLPFPMIISDEMPAAEHVDGKFYTSKSAFRRVTRENGLLEVGNDSQRFRTPTRPNTDKAIDESVERAFARSVSA